MSLNSTLTVAVSGGTATVVDYRNGPPLPSGWTQTAFYDDFTNGLSKWNVRNDDWSGNEYSIRLARNVTTQGGILHITAKHESVTAGSTTRQYSSGYLDTIGKFSQQYGRWEARMLLPQSKGMWPAFWLRCNSAAGELDIVEAAIGSGRTVQTVHQTTSSDQPKAAHEDSSAALTQWHTYWCEREPGVIRWGIDNRTVFVDTVQQTPWLDSALNDSLNIRLNLQVGGVMPKWYNVDVDSTTVFPADLQVDWVRVLTR